MHPRLWPDLRQDLQNPKARQILKNKGYNEAKAEHLIMQLIGRLNEEGSFPHEIDDENARKTFSRYKKCTDVYQRMNLSGKSLSQLTVEVKNAV